MGTDERDRQDRGRAGATCKRTSPGQVLIMFAVYSTALLGMLGLAVDLGYSFAERRSVQNAADLAAIAGTRVVARFDLNRNPSVSALPEVQAIIAENNSASGTTELVECLYLDQVGQEVGDCSLSVPANATGVRVAVTETHQTFFIRAVPGAPTQVTLTADASAQVERLDLAGTDAPFILCGYGAKTGSGGTMDVLLSDYVVNPDAIGQTFRIAGPNYNDIARCGAGSGASDNRTQGGKWRGLADKWANNGKRIVLASQGTGSWWNPKSGKPEGRTERLTNEVTGVQGCPELATVPFNCVMMLPVATEYDAASKRFKVTKIMAFDVWQGEDANSYWGTLIDDYLVYGASVPMRIDQAPWCRDCGSVVVARLVE